MSAVETKATHRRPPYAGYVQRIAEDTTATTTALDTDLVGQWITIKNTGSDTVYVLFGDSTVTVDATATSGATLGWPLASGEMHDWELKETDTHIALDCPSSTAVVFIARSSG